MASVLQQHAAQTGSAYLCSTPVDVRPMMPGSSGVAVNSVDVRTAVPLEQLTWGSPIVVEGLRLVILRCVPRLQRLCRVKSVSANRGLLRLGEEPK